MELIAKLNEELIFLSDFNCLENINSIFYLFFKLYKIWVDRKVK